MKISVRVTPNAKKPEIFDDGIDMLGFRTMRVKVSAPPEDGRANDATLKMLCEYFKTKDVRIVSGLKSRNKIFEIICSQNE
jgi:uncharacterized protein (TIGR00251 family)